MLFSSKRSNWPKTKKHRSKYYAAFTWNWLQNNAILLVIFSSVFILFYYLDKVNFKNLQEPQNFWVAAAGLVAVGSAIVALFKNREKVPAFIIEPHPLNSNIHLGVESLNSAFGPAEYELRVLSHKRLAYSPDRVFEIEDPLQSVYHYSFEKRTETLSSGSRVTFTGLQLELGQEIKVDLTVIKMGKIFSKVLVVNLEPDVSKLFLAAQGQQIQ